MPASPHNCRKQTLCRSTAVNQLMCVVVGIYSPDQKYLKDCGVIVDLVNLLKLELLQERRWLTG